MCFIVFAFFSGQGHIHYLMERIKELPDYEIEAGVPVIKNTNI